LPASVNDGVMNIELNVANLDITVPEGLAVEIKTDDSLSITNIDTKRFPKEGDYYVSPGYDTAVNRVVLNITSNIGRVTIK